MSSASTRDSNERTRRFLKRDYSRVIDEINKLSKATITIDVAEQLNTYRLPLAETKSKLDTMYMDYIGLLDVSNVEEKN